MKIPLSRDSFPMNPNLGDLCQWGRAEFRSVFSAPDIINLEVDVLLSYCLGMDRAGLIAHKTESVAVEAAALFQECVERRKRREPVAYITGVKEFYSLPFIVTPDVLIPRPETELAVDRVLAILEQLSGNVMLLDIGTGSGAIILTVLHEFQKSFKSPLLTAVASDICTKALAIAQQNAEVFGLSSIVEFLESDGFGRITVPTEVDTLLLVSNPPYVSISEQLESDVIDYEPLSALHAGDKGLDIIRQLIVESSELKGPNIRLVLEIGESQGDELDLLLRQNGFSEVSFSKDLWGRTRVVEAAKYNA